MHHPFKLLGASLLLGLLTGTAARAQHRTQYGVQAGGGAGWVHLRGQALYATRARPTWQLGVVAETRLASHWALQYGLGGAMRGYRLREDVTYEADQKGVPTVGRYRSQDAYRLTYLLAHTLLVYQPAGAGNGWQLLVGGYAGLGMRGRYRYQYTDSWGNITRAAAGRQRLVYGYRSGSGRGFGILGGGSSADIRPIDAGLQVGGGYCWQRVHVQACYQASLTPLLPGYLERQLQHREYLRGATISLSYFLPHSPRHSGNPVALQ
ncbi:outer membrane beta-barrel protein [Hymenobacter sp. UYP22]|uniref:outer membrane beta-barrel protein n=1 Tax=Hymenobacter sp. UYP22 TaxID=3156348 RepID=UPI00339457EE